VYLGTIITAGFLSLVYFRHLGVKKYVGGASLFNRPKRMFFLEFTVCICAATLIVAYQHTFLHFPLGSSGSVYIGCIISGFFIGLDSSLVQERQAIMQAIDMQKYGERSIKYFPITRKFTLIAATTFVFTCLVLVMVFTRDIEWLVSIAQDTESVASAQRSVTYEILFIMGVLTILVINLIMSYSKNLKLLFDNETVILEKVRNGDLTGKVPVATQDEFGVIASHTNHMIDGLRHRFELMHSLKLAEEVQQNLLPTKSPYLKGYDISGTSAYCDQTGGDYYDYFLLPDNRLGIAVADACGHGVGAAMLMTTMRAFLISAVEGYRDPATLVTYLNTMISRDCAASGNFTTLFFLEIDPAAQKLRWVRAGHEPPIVYQRSSGRFLNLKGEGIVLGIDEHYVFKARESGDFQRGDIMLIGTDGIFESRNDAGLVFGHETVNRVMSENKDRSAREIRDAILSAVSEFRGEQSQEDDITLVVVKVQPDIS